MSIEEFLTTTADRLPTVDEILGLAGELGWGFRVNNGQPALKANPSDPLAVGMARLLRREPWRTGLLTRIGADVRSPLPQEFAPVQCGACRAWWYETPTVELAVTLCPLSKCPTKSYRDTDGNAHPARPGCPYKASRN
jgi:hypothetical protein